MEGGARLPAQPSVDARTCWYKSPSSTIGEPLADDARVEIEHRNSLLEESFLSDDAEKPGGNMGAVRKLFDDDARKLTLTLQELQSMVSAVVAETIQLTRHVTDADAEVNFLSAGRSGGLGNTDDQGREAVAEDRRNNDARPRSRIGASTLTSRRTRGCRDKG